MTEALEDLASQFAESLGATLSAVLPDAPRVVALRQPDGDRYVVRPEGDSENHRVPMTLKVDGQPVATLVIALHVCWDHQSRYLAVQRSEVVVRSLRDRNPLLRLDYRRDMHNAPSAHWQVHAERGALTHLLTYGHIKDDRQVSKPWDLSSLHLPVGGDRFRPCVEDVLDMLVRDFGVDARPGWEAAIRSGRAAYRRLQVRAAARDVPTEAAAALVALGYTVEPPAAGTPAERENVLHRW